MKKRILVVEDEPSVMQREDFLVRQAVTNLVQNAIEFTPKGGKISATVKKTDTRVELIVKDNGSGIPAYAIGRIFERFYSLKRPDTGKKSSGLGLSVVKEVADLHNGAVTICNAPDGGVEARLSFPLLI
jgi:two-component system sensor histidine kinase CreC